MVLDVEDAPKPLPADVAQIIEHVAAWAAGYDTGLKWNEEAKLKADMMNVRHRWSRRRVDLRALRAKCLAEGLSEEETARIVDWVKRTQEGRRLVPQRGYRDFRFNIEPEPVEDDGGPGSFTTTRQWGE